MKDLVVVKREGLQVVPTSTEMGKGTYVIATKSKSGFPTISMIEADSVYSAFRRYRVGAILNLSFLTESGFALTAYSRKGKKINISSQLAKDLTVGDINDGSEMHKTALYSQEQYKAVNAKSWASKVFVNNK